jgi:hypothetical protein
MADVADRPEPVAQETWAEWAFRLNAAEAVDDAEALQLAMMQGILLHLIDIRYYLAGQHDARLLQAFEATKAGPTIVEG